MFKKLFLLAVCLAIFPLMNGCGGSGGGTGGKSEEEIKADLKAKYDQAQKDRGKAK